MTINSDNEVWEVVSYDNYNVVWFGSAEKLSSYLGYTTWEAGDTITWK